MGLVGVCLALLGAAAGKPIFIPLQQFTLAWIHTIEKVRWEEPESVSKYHKNTNFPIEINHLACM
jgi:hypothetical protein